MGTRLELQTKLEGFLGVRHVYYNPPSGLNMEYPAIRYSRSSDNVRQADNRKYTTTKQYDLIVISRESDPSVLDKILELPYSSMGRPYKSDNLNHYPITLYY